MHISFLAIFALIPRLIYAANLDDWRSRSIYQVVTDRFATEASGGKPPCDTGTRKYCGGTWNALSERLSYIQNMGFDAVWISPVISNVEGETAHGEAYHGYWPNDFYALNSHFGSVDDLKNLSKALHDRGMYLMVDIVINHMGPNTSATSFSSQDSFSGYKTFPQESSYHPFHFVSPASYDPTTSNQTDVEQGWLGDSVAPLPDLDTENTEVVRTLNDWVKGLVSNYSIDGLRIDTAKHIRQDFWPDFKSAAGVFTIGEVLHGDVEYVANYTRVLDSVLDYPTYFTIFSAFTAGPGQGNLSAIESTVTASQKAYQHGASSVGSFLENQDQPRILSKTKDLSMVLNAMTWPFIHDGIPIIYYGQEQGFAGGEDPNNREALWPTDYSTESPMLRHITSLNLARKLAISAKMNFLTNPMTFLPQSEHNSTTLAVSKPPLMALLTNAGSAATVTWTVPKKSFDNKERIVDVLTCRETVARKGSGDTLVFTSTMGMPLVLVPSSVLDTQKSDDRRLCPEIANAIDTNGSVQISASPFLHLALPLCIILAQFLV
ncbi:hypothetical protein EYR36_012006 [Pleurotus pulmonarius]|nr:hypothetical protein EYR36_012006 [Pleurotus pulmonarius]